MYAGQKPMKSLPKSYNPKRNAALIITAVVFFLLSAFISLLLGSAKLSVAEIVKIILNGKSNTANSNIFLFVRLPRTLACLVCGAALSVAGAVIQGVFGNRLASPSIIGVNAGAGVAVTVCVAFGLYGGWIMSTFAFLGAFLSVLLVSAIAHKSRASRGTVILLGVALNSLLGAFSDTIVTLIPEAGVLSNDFKVGEFSGVTYQKLIPVAVLCTLAIILLSTLTNELDIITLGDESAISLGVNIRIYRTMFLILAALLAGCAVSIAGLLSFVGLIVPHIIRRISGGSHRTLLPLCALFGGGFVCICDTVARTAFAPYEIPVGIIMAFVGAPFFILLLIRGKGGHSNA